jgi:ubiquinone/menaquinone biosynthesis C-methylase UbiE
LLGAAVLFVIIFLGWRLASHRYAIPCPEWLCWLVEIENPFFNSTRASTIIAHLDLKPGMSALDAGCGPGRLTIPMARKVGPTGRIVALDFQTGMLARAKLKAERANLTNIDFHMAKLGNNELQVGSFDRAVLVAVLGEIPDRQTALREIFGALTPGGILAITEVVADPHFQRRGNVAALACRVGFREKFRTGGRLAYSIYLEKPVSSSAAPLSKPNDL